MSIISQYERSIKYIPKIIHQIWVGDAEPHHAISTFQNNAEMEKHGWKHILWTDENISEFELIKSPVFREERDQACRADILRYEILYKYGGIFVDADSLLLNPNLDVFLDHDFFSCYENYGAGIGHGAINYDQNRIANGVIGCKKNNPILRDILDNIEDSYRENRVHGVVQSTGPDFFTRMVMGHKSKSTIFPCFTFYPIWWCTDLKRNPMGKLFEYVKGLDTDTIKSIFPRSYMFQYGDSSYQYNANGVHPSQ